MCQFKPLWQVETVFSNRHRQLMRATLWPATALECRHLIGHFKQCLQGDFPTSPTTSSWVSGTLHCLLMPFILGAFQRVIHSLTLQPLQAQYTFQESSFKMLYILEIIILYCNYKNINNLLRHTRDFSLLRNNIYSSHAPQWSVLSILNRLKQYIF